jgi:long-subunit fatty acid transport protein
VAAALRAGLVAEQSATTGDARNPGTPDGPRLGVALGGGYAIGRVQVDAGYLFLALRAARSTDARPGAPPAGTYRGRAHALALTLTVR